MCEIEFFSVEMFAIAWAIIGCSTVVGLAAYEEGKRNR